MKFPPTQNEGVEGDNKVDNHRLEGYSFRRGSMGLRRVTAISRSKSLAEGEVVRHEAESGPKGKKAINVTKSNTSPGA